MKKFMRGFTLIELMIVLAIVSIIIAFGYPSYRHLTGNVKNLPRNAGFTGADFFYKSRLLIPAFFIREGAAG